MSKIALIDGDGIAFQLGWNNKDHQDISIMHQQIDGFLQDMFQITGSDYYIGALSCSGPSFRKEIYKVKKYKGKRPEAADWVAFWRPVVDNYLESQYKFIRLTGLEADDIVAYLQTESKGQGIICSPDKDLEQVAGDIYDYRTSARKSINEREAIYNFWFQMLMGDDTDNVAGIPGLGEKKAKEILKPYETEPDNQFWATLVNTVKIRYHKHFGGEYYGEKIFQETYSCLRMIVGPDHPQFPEYEEALFSCMTKWNKVP